MQMESPFKLIDRLLLLRDMADMSREDRDLLADACNMISRQTDALNYARAYIKLWTDDRECNLLPTIESLTDARVKVLTGLCKQEEAA